MSADPFAGYGLRPVNLTDQATFRPHFNSLREPLSDYTFSQIYTWRNSLHLAWKMIRGHLCVFANGTGDLTLLVPPIGDGNGDAALREAFELMDDYNAARGVAERSRVEYASGELLGRFDQAGGQFDVTPMGADYVYDTARMIDLAGGDLASKRQAKNRFLRLYEHRVESYDPARHLDDCVSLLEGWRVHQDAQHLEEPNANAIKRQKETIATELALRSAADLGLKGMVVYVEGQGSRGQGAGESTAPAPVPDPRPLTPDPSWSLRAFTFGEHLGPDQSSIVIEKTDLEVKGLAQFIFSEFCRREWADRPLCNVGDDWGLESLAWTKQSYRPVKMLQKFTLKRAAVSGTIVVPASMDEPVIRAATKADLAATLELEQACFPSDLSLKKRQLEYLQRRDSAVFRVAERSGNVVGEGIALVRHHKQGVSGRIYSLAVGKNHRGSGIGQRLLRAMLAELVARGVKKVYLEVDRSNTAAVALYERNGFRAVGTLPDYYAPARDAVHMVCEVGAPAVDAPARAA